MRASQPPLCPQGRNQQRNCGIATRQAIAGIESDGLRATRRRTSWSRSAAGSTGSIRRRRCSRSCPPRVRRAGRGRAGQRPAQAGRGPGRPADRRAEPGPSVRGCRCRPEVRELERGTDVASWVRSVNVHRRHLDASQRALLASRLSALSGEVTLSQAGEMMGVSRASVARRPSPGSCTSRVAPTRSPGVVTPAHHELLDLAPVARHPGGAVSMAAPGPRPGPRSGHLPHSSLPRSGQVQPERPRGADPGVTPWFHVLGQQK